MKLTDQWKTTASFTLVQLNNTELYNAGPLKKARLAQEVTFEGSEI
jgi:hypothetical protein